MTYFIPMLLLSAVGCNDNMLGKRYSDQGIYGWPDIEVTPDSLDFGALGPHEASVQTFTIQSVGTETSILSVDDITIDSEAAFTILADSDDRSLLLPYGQERTFTVVFAPEHPLPYQAEVTIHSNDDDSPATPVMLMGRGLMPELQIDPDPIDFGTVNVGCELIRPVTLTNVGNTDLTVSSIDDLAGAFTVSSGPGMPLVLMPEESAELTVRFAPSAEVDYEEDFVATSDEMRGTRHATQHGVGHLPTSHVDRFSLVANPRADIVFYVDQSVSMQDDQEALARNFDLFIQRLSVVVPDWQLMVVTGDNGCSASGVLTPRTPDYPSRFMTATTDGLGGLYTEAGLSISYNAVLEGHPGGCNEGFLRDGALLHIIMVTDEPERSPQTWDYYVDRLIAQKAGDPMLLKLSAAAGDVPGGCTATGNTADAGTGYWEAVQETGGVFLSLCSDWADHVETLASATVTRASYNLSYVPEPSSVVVFVNSIRVDEWTYDFGTNIVTFEAGHVPTEGDLVEISYSEPSTCD